MKIYLENYQKLLSKIKKNKKVVIIWKDIQLLRVHLEEQHGGSCSLRISQGTPDSPGGASFQHIYILLFYFCCLG